MITSTDRHSSHERSIRRRLLERVHFGLIALSISLAMVAGPVAAQEKKASASPEQVKAIETWIYTLAVQAATYATPLVAMYNLRDSVAFGEKPKAPPNTFWRLEDISTPKLSAESGYVSPNVDVVTASASRIWEQSRSFSPRPTLAAVTT
jgi:hypothetical protein